MPADTIDFDHVAIAVERHTQAFPRYVGDLGGRWLSGGFSAGFAPAQLGFRAGARLEILAPHDIQRNDFLRRFLDHNGPGPHHLTFKVPDIHAALVATEAAGYRPVNVYVSDPDWQEAFIHPKDGPGVVVQLAHATQGDWQTPPPEGFPMPLGKARAAFVHVAHAMPRLEDGLRLFAEVLGGQEASRGEEGGERWVDLVWPGPGRIRLMEPVGPTSPLAEWIGERSGRIHHLAFTMTAPEVVSAAQQNTDGTWEVAPEDNLGVRLILLTPSSAEADPR